MKQLRVAYGSLPDLQTDRQLLDSNLYAYGRFALLRDSSVWIGTLNSSHPTITELGFYWGIIDADRDTLVISPRGCKSDYNILVNSHPQIIAWLVDKLIGLKVFDRPDHITIIK